MKKKKKKRKKLKESECTEWKEGSGCAEPGTRAFEELPLFYP
jgi:hypothetical protein